MLQLDAWIESPKPQLVVTDTHRCIEVLRYEGDAVRHLFDSGAITPEDCCHCDTAHDVIQSLILERLAEALYTPEPEAPTIARQIPPRRQTLRLRSRAPTRSSETLAADAKTNNPIIAFRSPPEARHLQR